MSKDVSGAIGIALILGTSAAIMWYLVYVARVGWIRERMLNGNRTQRAITALPVATFVLVIYMTFVRPLFP